MKLKVTLEQALKILSDNGLEVILDETSTTQSTDNKRVFTLEEGSKFLGLAKSTVYRLTSTGILPHSKPNGKVIHFEREKLEEWMLSNGSIGRAQRQIEAATYVATHPLIPGSKKQKNETSRYRN